MGNLEKLIDITSKPSNIRYIIPNEDGDYIPPSIDIFFVYIDPLSCRYLSSEKVLHFGSQKIHNIYIELSNDEKDIYIDFFEKKFNLVVNRK